MVDKPDWGHGPNDPVPVYTEDEIVKAMHACGCWGGDAVRTINQLREDRHGREASLHPNFAQR